VNSTEKISNDVNGVVPIVSRCFLPPEKFILDACCGGRMMWFNKQHPNAIYIDNREAESGHIGNGWNPGHCVHPDILMDFRKMDFPDKAFKLVVFDPPHLVNVSPKSILGKKYGSLDELHWGHDLKMALNECWRVLDDFGILLFKWNDVQISHKKVLELVDFEPLIMNVAKEKTAKQGAHRSYWFCFMKLAGQKMFG
jgi:hypothetical protein